MFKRVLMSGVVAGALVGCTDSGDVNLSPTNISNSGSTGGGSGSNVCASYTESGQTFQGTFDGENCVYSSLFVSDSKPITVDSITFSNFGGKHVFEDSLFIGEDVNATAAQSGKRIPQEGEGTRLNIAAGVTMVFKGQDSYVRIARGSQIFAEGTANNPITFTSDEDALLGTATENDRGQWGGLQINGNGRTNKCHDGTSTGSGFASKGTTSDFSATSNNVHNCHVTAEGRPATYGGNNNAENSGVLEYVVVKHAGFEVVDGDELNAITLNAVGSGTTISHVQAYTSQDDGFEMFGGAVNMDHIVAVNVGDDSIDYSEGYNGDIQYAVVVHTSGGNRCIEGDNTGGSRDDGFTPTTKLRISNLTCITSNVDENAGTNPSGKGDSEGPLYREGAFFEMYNSLVTSYGTSMASNECLELDDSEGPQTIDGAQNGTSIASSNVIACSEATKVGADAANSGFDLVNWLAGGGANAQTPANSNSNNVLITGGDVAASAIGSVLEDTTAERDYLTAANIQNGAGTTVFDQTSQLFDAATLGSIFKTPTYLGGANSGDNWLSGWAVGLDQPLNP